MHGHHGQSGARTHVQYVLETMEDVDYLVQAEAHLYACFLAIQRNGTVWPPGLLVPMEAFQDWIAKRHHRANAPYRSNSDRLPVHEEALRFRAYLMTTNDVEAADCLGMKRHTFAAWRAQRGHASHNDPHAHSWSRRGHPDFVARPGATT